LPIRALARHLLIGHRPRLGLTSRVPTAASVSVPGLSSTLACLTLTDATGFLPATTARFATAAAACLLASTGLALSTTARLLASAGLALSAAVSTVAASAIAAPRFAAGGSLPLGRVDRGHVR
jgi:hypothetical protein